MNTLVVPLVGRLGLLLLNVWLTYLHVSNTST